MEASTPSDPLLSSSSPPQSTAAAVVNLSSSPIISHPAAANSLPSTVPHPSRLSFPSNLPNGMGNCYVFKSRLQEYAQKVGIPTPVYQTVKEGPAHEPIFKSTVIVKDVKYESLPGFYSRKAAEQSAAEIAIMEIHKSYQMSENIPIVHETGLCKNLLQEYAQKMNYALPSYKCNINNKQQGVNSYICTVEIGEIQYIGAAARTKKEAEIKAARTALLAIQHGSETRTDGTSQYTVLPCKKKGNEQESRPQTMEELKPKKARMKKKWSKRKFPRKKGDRNKAAKLNNDEALSTENELRSSEMNDDGPTSQTNEMEPSAVESNVCCRDDQQRDGLITLNAERFEDSQEGKAMCSAFVQAVKPDATMKDTSSNAIGHAFTVEGDKGTLQPIM